MDGSQKKPKVIRALFFGGIVPIIAFTVIEEKFGTLWALGAGMAFGVGEVVFEWIRYRRVEAMTWIGNAMILVLGTVSLVTADGIWFKLQPAVIEAVMGMILFISVLMKKPLLSMMAKKQGAFDRLPDTLSGVMERVMSAMTFRVSFFLFANSLLATWAALYWSTRAWAFLKGVGFIVGLILYLFVEAVLMRKALSRAVKK